MMENNSNNKKIPAVNSVEGFEPAAFTRSITNEDGTMSFYLDVKFRMLWFRLRYPEGKLDTEIQSVTGQYAVVCCKVFTNKTDPADQYIAKSVAQRFASQEKYGDRFLEIAETAAVGRALAAAGFGTQFCSNAEVPNLLMDSPVNQSLLKSNEENGEAESSVNHETQAAVPSVEQEEAVPMMSQQTKKNVRVPRDRSQRTSANQNSSYICQHMVPAEPARQYPKVSPGSMTLEEAKSVIVDFGKYRGATLGQIAIISPEDIQWYVDHYAGSNKALKEGASVLAAAARKKVC